MPLIDVHTQAASTIPSVQGGRRGAIAGESTNNPMYSGKPGFGTPSFQGMEDTLRDACERAMQLVFPLPTLLRHYRSVIGLTRALMQARVDVGLPPGKARTGPSGASSPECPAMPQARLVPGTTIAAGNGTSARPENGLRPPDRTTAAKQGNRANASRSALAPCDRSNLSAGILPYRRSYLRIKAFPSTMRSLSVSPTFIRLHRPCRNPRLSLSPSRC
jgi:hypothetical protein